MSTIFDDNLLKNQSNGSKFDMLNIMVNYNNNNKLSPIGCMKLNFHFYDHLIEKSCIKKYISNYKNRRKLNGFFSINYEYSENCIVLEKFRTFEGNKEIIDKMITHIVSEKISKINEELIKMI